MEFIVVMMVMCFGGWIEMIFGIVGIGCIVIVYFMYVKIVFVWCQISYFGFDLYVVIYFGEVDIVGYGIF